jgi:hypothetical protein
MEEIWKDITDFEGLYKISNLGKIKRIPSIKCKKERYIAACLNDNGYYIIRLYKNSKGKCAKLHRLIAQAFIPTVEGKTFINHINGIKTDNRIENLEWCTKAENSQHAIKMGLHKIQGSKHFAAKLDEEKVLSLRREYKERKMKVVDLQRKYGISKSAFHQIVNRVRWRHI